MTAERIPRTIKDLDDVADANPSNGDGLVFNSGTGLYEPNPAASGGITQGDLDTAVAGLQPLDSDLTAIAALASANDKLLYATGSGTWALTSFTAAGRALVDDLDASTQRSTLGLGTLATQSGTFSGTSSGTNTGDQTTVSGNAGTATALQNSRTIDGQTFDGTGNITVVAPGTHAASSKATPVDADEVPLVDSAASNVLKKLTWANLKATLKTYFDGLYDATGAAASAQAASQPLDADLTALAGVTSGANKLPYFTGSGAASVTDLSAFARTFIDDADAATVRATLGVGSGSVATDTIFDAKGDLAIGTGADTAAKLTVGTSIVDRLIADSSTSTGLKWVKRVYVKAGDETVNNSAVLQDDDHFAFPIAANEKWLLTARLIMTATGTTPDFKCGWTFPSGLTMFWGSVGASNVVGQAWSAVGVAVTAPTMLTEASTLSVGSSNGTFGVQFEAIIINSSTAGTLQFQWSQDTQNASNTIEKANSLMLVERLA